MPFDFMFKKLFWETSFSMARVSFHKRSGILVLVGSCLGFVRYWTDGSTSTSTVLLNEVADLVVDGPITLNQYFRATGFQAGKGNTLSREKRFFHTEVRVRCQE